MIAEQQGLVISGIKVARGGKEVVHGVDLVIPGGKIVALLGPNGAGKSSLVLTLAGVLPATAGEVLLNGENIVGKKPNVVRALGLATVPEGHRVLGELSVADNLRTASLLLARSDRAAAVEKVLQLFPELVALKERLAGALSGGQQQLLALAQALVGDPKFLVIDEMSLGLAPIVVRRLVPALEAVASSGIGVLLIEQFTEVALALASDAYAMTQGNIVLSQPSAVLRENPELLERAYSLR